MNIINEDMKVQYCAYIFHQLFCWFPLEIVLPKYVHFNGLKLSGFLSLHDVRVQKCKSNFFFFQDNKRFSFIELKYM